MTILVTNDDGISSPGLLALRQALMEVDTTIVVAPDRNWSAASSARTFFDPLRVDPTSLADGSSAFVCTGTPSDCVALAALGILEEPPQLVVSGINIGANLAQDVIYSGTVSAAREGVVAGIPSIAVSLHGHRDSDFRPAADFAARLARELLLRGLDPGILLNVNVPPGEHHEVVITRLGRRIYRDELIVRHDPRGRPYYWIGGDDPEGALDDGTDTAAIANGAISVTPLHFELTNTVWLDRLRTWRLFGVED
jgi:5'-nucleotidase